MAFSLLKRINGNVSVTCLVFFNIDKHELLCIIMLHVKEGTIIFRKKYMCIQTEPRTSGILVHTSRKEPSEQNSTYNVISFVWDTNFTEINFYLVIIEMNGLFWILKVFNSNTLTGLFSLSSSLLKPGEDDTQS